MRPNFYIRLAVQIRLTSGSKSAGIYLRLGAIRESQNDRPFAQFLKLPEKSEASIHQTVSELT